MNGLIRVICVLGLGLFGTAVIAGADVVEGDPAKALYEQHKADATILVQKNKIFVLRHQGKEVERPEEVSVKVGELFFIVNEEEKYIHNVYDINDESWILKKQEPGGVAAIKFTNPGAHALRCAIHPTMKTLMKVDSE